MHAKKMLSAFAAAVLLSATIGCPAYAAAKAYNTPVTETTQEANSQQNKEKINTLLTDEDGDNVDVKDMSLREIIILRLRAAHKKGIFLDVTEDQINSLTNDELENLAKAETPREYPVGGLEPTSEGVEENIANLNEEQEQTFFERVRKDFDPETGTYGIMLGILGSVGAGGFLLLKHQRDRILAQDLAGRNRMLDLENAIIKEAGDWNGFESIELERNQLKKMREIKNISQQSTLDLASLNSKNSISPMSLERFNSDYGDAMREIVKERKDMVAGLPSMRNETEKEISARQAELETLERQGLNTNYVKFELNDAYYEKYIQEKTAPVFEEWSHMEIPTQITKEDLKSLVHERMQSEEDRLRNALADRTTAWNETLNKELQAINEEAANQREFAEWKHANSLE